MALGAEVAEGTRKLTVIGRVISGLAPDLTSLAFRPIFRPFSVFAVLRVVDSAGSVFDLEMTWQALPKLADNADLGATIGAVPGEGAGSQGS